MHDSIFEHEINILSIKEIYLIRGFKSSHFLYTTRVFIIRMTKQCFPLLSVNLLNDEPVLHPEKIWGQQFQLEGRALFLL